MLNNEIIHHSINATHKSRSKIIKDTEIYIFTTGHFLFEKMSTYFERMMFN